MTGRHEAPPLGSAAREATAAPWHGRHRQDDDASAEVKDAPTDNVCDRCRQPVIETAKGWEHAEYADLMFCSFVFGGLGG